MTSEQAQKEFNEIITKNGFTGAARTNNTNNISIGFDNSLYFSKTFHKIKGLSPKEYRSKYKKA